MWAAGIRENMPAHYISSLADSLLEVIRGGGAQNVGMTKLLSADVIQQLVTLLIELLAGHSQSFAGAQNVADLNDSYIPICS